MEPFTVHRGKIAIYCEDNIDTDRIIPARYLSRVTRSGYGEMLFVDVRKDGHPLDSSQAKGASVLVVGTNFGCGSSREHAVWAIQQAGFRLVISRMTNESAGFSDIFRQNAANCGLLLIELAQNDHKRIVDLGQGATITVHLEEQTISSDQLTLRFDINPVIKNALLEGLDLIGSTLKYESVIERHEAESSAPRPHVD